jgi:hypothetical protein
MRVVFRFFAVTLLCAALATFVAPRRMQATPKAEMNCCAHMQMNAGSPACPHQAPAKERDQSSCCQLCSLGLALLFVKPPSFVYAQTGEEEFLVLSAHTDAMPHRPPVPPPRTSPS